MESSSTDTTVRYNEETDTVQLYSEGTWHDWLSSGLQSINFIASNTEDWTVNRAYASFNKYSDYIVFVFSSTWSDACFLYKSPVTISYGKTLTVAGRSYGNYNPTDSTISYFYIKVNGTTIFQKTQTAHASWQNFSSSIDLTNYNGLSGDFTVEMTTPAGGYSPQIVFTTFIIQ